MSEIYLNIFLGVLVMFVFIYTAYIMYLVFTHHDYIDYNMTTDQEQRVVCENMSFDRCSCKYTVTGEAFK